MQHCDHSQKAEKAEGLDSRPELELYYVQMLIRYCCLLAGLQMLYVMVTGLLYRNYWDYWSTAA